MMCDGIIEMNRLAYLILALAIGIVFPAHIAQAGNRVSVELSLLQKVDDKQATRVVSDTASVPDDGALTVQLGNLVFDLELLSVSDEAVNLRIEMITSGPGTKRFFASYIVPYGLPIIIDSVIVRNKSLYRASVTPLAICEIERECQHDVTDTTAFLSDPAPHFQIYYVPESLGDYHWNGLRAYLEEEGRALDRLCRFDDPQPTSFFILPCRPTSVHFDKYYDFAIDPVKDNVMAIYNHDEKHVSSLPVNMLKFYRYWGYAPRFFAEGIGAFADFNDFYLKEYLGKHSLPDLRKYFNSEAFLAFPDREVMRQAAGSFCNYLVSRYGITKFKEFWDISTDLTAASDLASVYDISADWLVGEWEQYLNTLKIDNRLFRYHAQRLSHLRDYEEANRLLLIRFKATGGDREQMLEIGNYFYLLGDYENAQEYFGKVLREDSVKVTDVLTYANMLLMNGKLDSALTWYGKAILQDSTEGVAYYKTGRIYHHLGDLDKALEYYHKAAAESEDLGVVIDAQIGIGLCLRELNDEDSASVYFASALNGSKVIMVGGDPKPAAIMRAGEAFLQLGQPEAAIEHLEFAIFVEERLFYIGRMALALGEAYDLLGNRTAAIESYNLTKSAPGGYLFREEADKYISKPFTLKR